MTEVWQKIVSEALVEGVRASKGAVPGARLRQLIAKIAQKYGEVYPPSGHKDEKFGLFLHRFSSLLITLPRDGQDILIAPADQPQLLDSPETMTTQLREDIFEAFTRIPREQPPQEPWYAPVTDKVVWLPRAATPSEGLIGIPPATLNQELDDRRKFASSSALDTQIKDKLIATLEDHAGLWAFSRVLKEHGLARKWHLFRFQALIMRIRGWCEHVNIDWREEWLYSKTPQKAAIKQAHSSFAPPERRRQLEKFIETISDDDIKRISVPLDIVLKLFPRE